MIKEIYYEGDRVYLDQEDNVYTFEFSDKMIIIFKPNHIRDILNTELNDEYIDVYGTKSIAARINVSNLLDRDGEFIAYYYYPNDTTYFINLDDIDLDDILKEINKRRM